MTTWPVIQTAGGPGDRGRRYGEETADRIRRSIDIYTRVFRHYAGLEWQEVRDRARAFAEPIEAYEPSLLEELEGMADGAGLHLEDVLALNVRTEVMFGLGVPVKECTAVVVLPEATANGHTLLAQNWDWKPEMRDTCVLLVSAPDVGPAFVTLVEAGLLAKCGMNAAGIGLCANALQSDRDQGKPAVPFHAILRRILSCEFLGEAANAVLACERSSSANYVVAHRDGEALDLEAAPGDSSAAFPMWPSQGVLSHANHFQSPRFPFVDTGLVDGADSLVRQHRAEKALASRPRDITVESVQQALRDHFDRPSSVCAHADPAVEEIADYVTVSSVVMDLTDGAMWVSAGPPCEVEYTRYRTADLFHAAATRNVPGPEHLRL